MADSDDYFDDSLILDDDALAILQQAEEEFASKNSTQAAQPRLATVVKLQDFKSRLSNIRPPKVLRSSSSVSSQDVDELPDIILQDDGSYFIQGKDIAPQRDNNLALSATHSSSSNKPIVAVRYALYYLLLLSYFISMS